MSSEHNRIKKSYMEYYTINYMFRLLYIGHPQVFLKLIELLYKQYGVLWVGRVGGGGGEISFTTGMTHLRVKNWIVAFPMKQWLGEPHCFNIRILPVLFSLHTNTRVSSDALNWKFQVFGSAVWNSLMSLFWRLGFECGRVKLSRDGTR
jgi:hypothetical protein